MTPATRVPFRKGQPLTPSLTVVEALHDRRLLGGLATFRDLRSWGRWLVFYKAVYGRPLDREERAIYEHHTHRSTYTPPAGGFPESAAIVGRQSGKSRIAGVTISCEGLSAPPQADSDVYSLAVAQDHRGATRTLLRYARGPFEQLPSLKPLVAHRTTDTLTLTSGMVIASYPCRPAALRGLRARVAVADELAFFRNTEGNPVDTEMLRALRPTLATTGGKLIILSSPYGQSGALWQVHRAHFGREDSTTLVWPGSAPEMNPTLPADYLARMEQDDPEAYRSEVLGEFRAGLTQLFTPEAIDACVERGVRERPKADPGTYVAFCDPSSGSGKDASRWPLRTRTATSACSTSYVRGAHHLIPRRPALINGSTSR